VGHKSSRRYWY